MSAAETDPSRLLHGLLDRHERGGDDVTATARIDEDRFHSVADWDAFLAVMRSVETAGGIRLGSGRGRDRDAIRSLRLTDPAVVYRFLDRSPSREVAAAAVALTGAVAEEQAFQSVVQVIEAAWARHRQVFGLKPNEADRLQKALALARGLRDRAAGHDMRQLDYRSFSRGAAGDSKALAGTLEAVAALLRAEDPLRLADLSAEEVIALHGVERLPAPVLISGPIALNGERLPAAEYLGLPGGVVEQLSVAGAPAYILSIENYTSFIRHARERTPQDGGLAVYTGGFPSRATLSVLLKLATAATSPVYHWGDIDPGGLRIFRMIEMALQQVDRPLHPHLMTIDLLRARGQTDRQRRRLVAGRAAGSAIAPLWDALAQMEVLLELEQEALEPETPPTIL